MSVQLSFTMQHQLQTNWCWAADSSSVSHFYNPGSSWSQCAIANKELGRSDCCGSGASGPCNQDGYLDVALGITGNLKSWTAGTEPFATVMAEINAKLPLCVRIGWSGGGGHFISLTGYFNLNLLFIVLDMVTVDDPWYGRSLIPYSTVVNGYQGSGSWTHSYFTKA